MQIAAVPGLQRVDWYVDGKLAASTRDASYPWPLQRGTHSVHAQVWTNIAHDTDNIHDTESIRFYVH
jgi:hypothetical protein